MYLEACDQAIGSIDNSHATDENKVAVYNAIKSAYPWLNDEDITFKVIGDEYVGDDRKRLQRKYHHFTPNSDIYTDGHVHYSKHLIGKDIVDFNYALIIDRSNTGRITKVSAIFNNSSKLGQTARFVAKEYLNPTMLEFLV